MREFHQFNYKYAKYRICGFPPSPIFKEIKKQRTLIERYIYNHPEFQSALTPIVIKEGAPDIVIEMANAAELTGVGPMAAVAGVIAEYAVKVGIGMEDEKKESIVENGGDIFLSTSVPIVIGLFLGHHILNNRIALRILPESTPLALCSSSSTMGHSLSFGACDCATIAATSGAIADAAATAACNKVKTKNDIKSVLDWLTSVPKVKGALIIKDDAIGICGDFPEIISHTDPSLINKITYDKSWSAFIKTIQ